MRWIFVIALAVLIIPVRVWADHYIKIAPQADVIAYEVSIEYANGKVWTNTMTPQADGSLDIKIESSLPVGDMAPAVGALTVTTRGRDNLGRWSDEVEATSSILKTKPDKPKVTFEIR